MQIIIIPQETNHSMIGSILYGAPKTMNIDNLIVLDIQEDEILPTGSSHYLNDTTLVIRPNFEYIIDKNTILANGTDIATITNLPENTNVIFNDNMYVVEDGSIEVSSTKPAKIILSLDNFPYKREELIINAT